jgi:hypothetical protein
LRLKSQQSRPAALSLPKVLTSPKQHVSSDIRNCFLCICSLAIKQHCKTPALLTSENDTLAGPLAAPAGFAPLLGSTPPKLLLSCRISTLMRSIK